MDSKETKKWYYVLPVVSIGIFILAWVWLSSAENSMIPTPLATWEKFLNIMTNPISQAILPVTYLGKFKTSSDRILLCYRSWSWTWCRPWLEQNLQCSC